ncbi:hypothetical protein [Alkalibacter mobilis]|uniref:hypothetical protein n=1 Tax=Alkalibacter mobilis TaxID=2787712 RepID=UPI00189CDCD4|nr:hypothetical protein [Alkalibacter mobilis]MBF7096988.1 hypothetical protein [Alkalibacter mobilis]
MSNSENKKIPDHAINSYRLGLASVGSLVVSLVIGLTIRTVGLNNLFLPIVIPLSLLTVFASRSSMNKFDDKNSLGYKKALMGFKLGLAVLIGVVAFLIVATIFFSLAFPRGR